VSYLVVQGNNGRMSHRGLEQFAFDFAMPVGSLVVAARSGRISMVEENFTAGGPDFTKYATKGNYVLIDHGDGTSGLYLHLMHKGAIVKPGEQVVQGQPIAYSGQTGFASGPHLHFQLEHTSPNEWFTQSMPVGFAEVPETYGVPQEGTWYRSANGKGGPAARPPPTTNPVASAPPDAHYVSDVTIPDGTKVFQGEKLTKRWRMTNTGALPWPDGTVLRRIGGGDFGVSDPVHVDSLAPGASGDVTALITAPASTGTGEALWQLTDPHGTPFGDRLWIRVDVTGPPPTAGVAAESNPDALYFGVTGHNIEGAFATFFTNNGGLDIFGYPRTEAIDEGGLKVQYFQRARFEEHPDLAGTPFEVQLTLLGDQITADVRPFPTTRTFRSSTNRRFFPATGHGVYFGFLRYFDANGGLQVFGYPTSEELQQSGPNGTMTIQYFQRARFEYHPENAGTRYEVQLGLLGDEVLLQRGWLPIAAPTTAVDSSVSGKSGAPQATNSTVSAPPTPQPTPTPAPVVAATHNIVEVTVSALHVRALPDTSSAIVGVVHLGDRLDVLEANGDGWLRVRAGGSGISGWIDGQYTKPVK
jgi:hypothetical protein